MAWLAGLVACPSFMSASAGRCEVKKQPPVFPKQSGLPGCMLLRSSLLECSLHPPSSQACEQHGGTRQWKRNGCFMFLTIQTCDSICCFPIFDSKWRKLVLYRATQVAHKRHQGVNAFCHLCSKSHRNKKYA